MAVGNADLNNFECDRMDISLMIDGPLRNSWNTFQYVANHLSAWANGTEIGAESQAEFIKLAKELDELLTHTKNFIGKLDNFASLQREINNGY